MHYIILRGVSNILSATVITNWVDVGVHIWLNTLSLIGR